MSKVIYKIPTIASKGSNISVEAFAFSWILQVGKLYHT